MLRPEMHVGCDMGGQAGLWSGTEAVLSDDVGTYVSRLLRCLLWPSHHLILLSSLAQVLAPFRPRLSVNIHSGSASGVIYTAPNMA